MPLSDKFLAKQKPPADPIEPAFTAWKQTPGPATLSPLLTALDPSIRKGVEAHLGRFDPVYHGHAKRLAVEAVKSYDPSHGAKLQTHVINRLRGLQRIAANRGLGITVPERVRLERNRLQELEKGLTHEFGRPPTSQELSDRLGLSLSRLATIRGYKPPVTEGQMAMIGGDMSPEVLSLQKRQTWTDLVYDDLSPPDKLVLEHTLGLHGSPVLSNQELASRLRVTPGAVSQRKAKIQSILDLGETLSPFGR